MSAVQAYNDVTARLRREADARDHRGDGRSTTALLREAASDIERLRVQVDEIDQAFRRWRDSHSHEGPES